MLGEDVYSIELNSDELTHAINLGNTVAEGIYLVEVYSRESIVTKQVVIQR
jgi:hypothetical protein